jgi:uncharacterized protein (TIGR03067 family)
MNPYAATLLVASLLVPAAPVPKEEDDAKALQGTWVATSFEEHGKAVPEKQLKDGLKGMKWVFADGKLTWVLPGDKGEERVKFAYKLDPTKSPKALDLTPEAPAGGKADPTVLAIYKVEKDQLTVCLGPKKGGDRPTEFRTAENLERAIIVFKREKP